MLFLPYSRLGVEKLQIRPQNCKALLKHRSSNPHHTVTAAPKTCDDSWSTTTAHVAFPLMTNTSTYCTAFAQISDIDLPTHQHQHSKTSNLDNGTSMHQWKWVQNKLPLWPKKTESDKFTTNNTLAAMGLCSWSSCPYNHWQNLY